MKLALKIFAWLSLGGLLLFGLLVVFVILTSLVPRRPTGKFPIEFRILANRRHDWGAAVKALAPDGLDHPPSRYLWARLGEFSTGTNPKGTASTIVDPAQNWKKNIYSGSKVELTGKDATGNETSALSLVTKNSSDTLTLQAPHGLKSVTSYRVEYNPSGIHAPDPTRPMPNDPIVREEKPTPGKTELYVLVQLDRQNVDETQDRRRLLERLSRPQTRDRHRIRRRVAEPYASA